MEDLRKNKLHTNHLRKLKWLDFLTLLKKNWVKILITILIGTILLLPTFSGNIIGLWFNKISTAIINNLTY